MQKLTDLSYFFLFWLRVFLALFWCIYVCVCVCVCVCAFVNVFGAYMCVCVCFLYWKNEKHLALKGNSFRRCNKKEKERERVCVCVWIHPKSKRIFHVRKSLSVSLHPMALTIVARRRIKKRNWNKNFAKNSLKPLKMTWKEVKVIVISSCFETNA